MALPLAGVRILDLTRLLPGPYATLVLADLGADVVKVEDPQGGDWLRWMPPLAGEQSGAFHALNRNKRSLAIDLRRAEGVEAFLRLAARADAVVESFRPGVLDRLGVGYEALRARAPGLVLCSISGYGQDGPYAGRAGHDLDYCAVSGVLAANGPPDAPRPLGVQVADVAGGAWPAVAGILAALVRRASTGEGAHVDVSMTEGALALLAMPLGMAWARGAPLARGRELLDGGAGCYGVYRTRDGRFVALAALEPRFFAAFCEAVGRPELASRQWDEGGAGARAELAAIFAARTRDEWAAFAAAHDACVAPVLEGDEPRADPQLAARGAFLEVDTPWEGRALPAVASPVRLRGEAAPRRPAPRLGEHGEAVLAEAGFSPAEIAALRASGALGA
ncbi:L-carnitine dehydratase/bile acid-inducible protein F [Anaeromyxobacter dehalogenans 2CP-1]|uniref:L-carnitine dehydratase/bile acid-inducible protein F n=1 Tax=Anaeromyxobacter dehalogenans (strain ATCC BAA-258 / DSM 21875 / 2CP-1) TaxID=455488 RepID=B8J5L9_ANAD2|nr:CaiB/BaiF CoA-transferase family protein [Anaeromyxobacter dehalogenans]ACL64966.1 L-carnitine dehydratase/bile acid-inducible protein F [Anaeromyxobacter dehalogenans 2CP-1]